MKTVFKIILWIVGILLVMAVIGAVSDNGEDNRKEEPKKENTQKSEPKKENTQKSEDKKEDTDIEDDYKVDTLEDTSSNEISSEFADDAELYMIGLGDTYTKVSELSTAEDEVEMMAIIKVGQSKFESVQSTLNSMTPENDKEQVIYDKLIEINGLTDSALSKAESGLIDEDIPTIESATDDILSANEIIESLEKDLNE